MEGNCSKCRFWAARANREDIGQCRRYPPKLFKINPKKVLPLDYEMLNSLSYFPVTCANVSCGEFAPK